MSIEIRSKDFSVTDPIREYAERREPRSTPVFGGFARPEITRRRGNGGFPRRLPYLRRAGPVPAALTDPEDSGFDCLQGARSRHVRRWIRPLHVSYGVLRHWLFRPRVSSIGSPLEAVLEAAASGSPGAPDAANTRERLPQTQGSPNSAGQRTRGSVRARSADLRVRAADRTGRPACSGCTRLLSICALIPSSRSADRSTARCEIARRG